jgi:hypothetical protein
MPVPSNLLRSLATFAAVLTISGTIAAPKSKAHEGDELEEIGCVTLPAFVDQDQSENVSGAALSSDGGLLAIATDEGSELLVVSAQGQTLEFLAAVPLGDPKDEIDLEGITRHADPATFFAIGSHSWRRKNIYGENHADKSYSKLKERFEDESPDRERDRDRLMRIELDPQTGVLASLSDLPLRQLMEANPVLGVFGEIPSKENGIDIEGIASDGEKLYLGFRGPVFRGGLTPVLVASATDLSGAELRYVPLDGRGIRDIARVSDGFLILAGPVGDSPLSYELVFWDGTDAFPGVREPGDPPHGRTSLLGTIPTPPGGKAEALVVLAEHDGVWVTEDSGFWPLLVMYDGPAGGGPACFRALRP